MSALELLQKRRSVMVKDMQEPGPSAEQLDTILEIAHRVPDHRKMGPWRFVVFKDDARSRFSEHLAKSYAKDNPDATDTMLEFQRNILCRAPLVIAVISCVDTNHKTPEWEQVLTVGAVCQNMLLAATELGYGAQWITEWYTYHQDTRELLALESDERIAGFIYIGSHENKPKERERPSLADRVTIWE